jgi:hypothetical protein
LRPLVSAPSLIAAALLWAGASGCESGFDRNDQIVNSLRILGAAAHIDNGDGVDWADAQVGDTVTLSALVANPTGIPTVTVTWLTCLPSLNDTLTPCADEQVLRQPTDLIPMAADPTSGVIQLGIGQTIQYTVPQEVQPLLDQLIARAQGEANAECSIFIEAPLIIIAQGSDGSVVTALKNLRLSPWSRIGPVVGDPTLQYYVRNANPDLTALNLAADFSVCAGQKTLVKACGSDADCDGVAHSCSTEGWCPPTAPFPTNANQLICAQLAANAAQTYYYCGLHGADGSEPEEPSITWYETAGTQGGVSNSNTAGTADLKSRTFETFTRPPGAFTLYGVVRDGRDGENWIAQDFPQALQ